LLKVLELNENIYLFFFHNFVLKNDLDIMLLCFHIICYLWSFPNTVSNPCC